jgi:D-alanyl-D-alanine carboxypeptidase
MQRVRGLAGYLTTERGERLAFAILVNNHGELSGTAKAAIDDIATALATVR